MTVAVHFFRARPLNEAETAVVELEGYDDPPCAVDCTIKWQVQI